MFFHGTMIRQFLLSKFLSLMISSTRQCAHNDTYDKMSKHMVIFISCIHYQLVLLPPVLSTLEDYLQPWGSFASPAV